MREEYAFSQQRACRLLTVAVSSYRYQSRRTDEPLRTRLIELAREKPRFGYRRLHVLLRRAGEAVNHKRVHRVYREAGLGLRRKKRKHCVRVGAPLQPRTAANQEWALDFAHEPRRRRLALHSELATTPGIRIMTPAETGGRSKGGALDLMNLPTSPGYGRLAPGSRWAVPRSLQLCKPLRILGLGSQLLAPSQSDNGVNGL